MGFLAVSGISLRLAEPEGGVCVPGTAKKRHPCRACGRPSLASHIPGTQTPPPGCHSRPVAPNSCKQKEQIIKTNSKSSKQITFQRANDKSTKPKLHPWRQRTLNNVVEGSSRLRFRPPRVSLPSCGANIVVKPITNRQRRTKIIKTQSAKPNNNHQKQTRHKQNIKPQ